MGVIHCQRCGTELPERARFCLACGQPTGGLTLTDRDRLGRLTAAMPVSLAQKMRSAGRPGERRVVTVLFADVVGSTSLAERMDPEDWSEFINLAWDWLSPAIYRYEGSIAHILGDGLVAFFGSPVVHEDDPIRAVRAALDLLEVTKKLSEEVARRRGIEFAIRVGLNTGLVVVGEVGSDLKYEYTAIGDAVNVAARMQSAARPLSVLLSEHTYRFVAPLFDVVDLGPISVKGKADPVRVYEVTGEKLQPEPLRGVGVLRSPMVGRDLELRSLLERSSALANGSGGMVVIVGEPGLGKSRLIAEWRARLATSGGDSVAGVGWVEGHCLSYGRAVAYHALVELVRALVGVSTAAREREDGGRLRDRLVEQVGEDATQAYPYLAHLLSVELAEPELQLIRSLDPQALQAQYLRALRMVLGGLCARRPLVVVVEDAHWADATSARLMGDLLLLTVDLPLLFCFTARPERDAPSWEPVMAARRPEGISRTELVLNGLADNDSRRLVDNLLGIDALAEEAKALILERSEGNPLFLEEMLRMLIDRGSIGQEGGRWVARGPIEPNDIPDTLQGLLLARIDRLPPDAKHLLLVASVIGRRFPLGILEELLTPSTVQASLATLESADLIRLVASDQEPEYLFRHALIHAAAYESLLRRDRMQLHLAIGEALERLHTGQPDEVAATLAFHFERAEAAEKAATYFARAAQHATATYANTEAGLFYRSAIRLLKEAKAVDEAGMAASLHEGLGDVLELGGLHDQAQAELTVALSLLDERDRIGRARVHRRLGASYHLAQRLGESAQAFVAAEAALGAEPLTPDAGWWHEWVQVQLDHAWLLYFQNRDQALTELLDRARPKAEAWGTSVQRVRLLHCLILLAFRRDRYVISDETLEFARRQLETAIHSGDLRVIALSEFMAGFTFLWHEDLDEAEHHLQAGLSIAQRIGDTILEYRSLTYLPVVARKRGDPAGVRRYLPRLLEVSAAPSMLHDYVAAARAHQGWLAWKEGDLKEAQAKGSEAVEGWREVHVSPYPWQWLARLPLLAIAIRQDRLPDAIEQTRAMLAPPQQILPAELERVLQEALMAWDKTDPTAARAALGRAVRTAGRIGYL
jgi:class 3 adenylate cyclase